MIAVVFALLLSQEAPDEPRWMDRLEQHDAQKATQAVEQLPSLSSSSTAFLRRVARSNAAAKRYAQAIAAYERLIEINRSDVDAWFHLAELHAWTGRHDKAVVTLRDALAIHPHSRVLRNGLARVLRWMRRYDETEALYREVLRAAPEDREAMKGLADVCARTGNFEEAGVLISRALRLYPRDAELHKEKGNILAWQKQYRPAVDALSKATELAPGYGDAYVTLGDVYCWMKSYDRAIEAYKSALALDPDNLEVHLMLARTYQKTGDKELALRHARRAHDIKPVNAQADELVRELEGRRWYSAVEAAGHLAEYITFAGVFSLVYLNYRRSRRILRRRHKFYHIFTHAVLPGVAIFAFLLYLTENYFSIRASVDPDIFHSIGEAVIVLILGLSFIELVYAERRPSADTPRVILAIGAHPDDIELGCGGFLLKEKDHGSAVYGLTVSRGERGMEGLNDRSSEQQKAAKFLGLDNMLNLGIPDTAIRDHLRDVEEAIERKIRETGATVILTHSPLDVHSDHQAVFDATKEAARNAPMVLCYEDVGTPKEFVPNYFSDITDYIEDKVRLVAFHRSQRLKPYMDPATIRGRASYRGLQSNVPFAEAFRINRIVI